MIYLIYCIPHHNRHLNSITEKTNDDEDYFDDLNMIKSGRSSDRSRTSTNGNHTKHRSNSTQSSIRESSRLDAIIEERVDYSNTYNANTETFEVFEYSAPESHNAKESYYAE